MEEIVVTLDSYRRYACALAYRALRHESERGREPHPDLWESVAVASKYANGSADRSELQEAHRKAIWARYAIDSPRAQWRRNRPDQRWTLEYASRVEAAEVALAASNDDVWEATDKAGLAAYQYASWTKTRGPELDRWCWLFSVVILERARALRKGEVDGQLQKDCGDRDRIPGARRV